MVEKKKRSKGTTIITRQVFIEKLPFAVCGHMDNSHIFQITYLVQNYYDKKYYIIMDGPAEGCILRKSTYIKLTPQNG